MWIFDQQIKSEGSFKEVLCGYFYVSVVYTEKRTWPQNLQFNCYFILLTLLFSGEEMLH